MTREEQAMEFEKTLELSFMHGHLRTEAASLITAHDDAIRRECADITKIRQGILRVTLNDSWTNEEIAQSVYDSLLGPKTKADFDSEAKGTISGLLNVIDAFSGKHDMTGGEARVAIERGRSAILGKESI